MGVSTTLLGDRYELGRLLGRGGMARVYEGHDRVLDRRVAIKVLDARLAADAEFVTRFQREARAAARLAHPGVVAVYDTGEHDGTRFIVMEYVEGRTLADVLAEGPLSPARAVEVGREVLAALGAAHDRGLVHRDVKPANIMVTPEGALKVMDFGIARAAEDGTRLTTAASVIGTPSYMAPEQVEARPVDARTDLYALGAVLYECLVGAPPFEGSSAITVAARHVNDAPEPLRRRRPEIPPRLEAVVLRALAKDPADRWPEAAAFRAALEDAVEPGAGAAAAGAGGAGAGWASAGAAGAGGLAATGARAGAGDGWGGAGVAGTAVRRRGAGRALTALGALVAVLLAGLLAASLGGDDPAAPPSPTAAPAAGAVPAAPEDDGGDGQDGDGAGAGDQGGAPAGPAPTASPTASAPAQDDAAPSPSAAPTPAAPPSPAATAPPEPSPPRRPTTIPGTTIRGTTIRGTAIRGRTTPMRTPTPIRTPAAGPARGAATATAPRQPRQRQRQRQRQRERQRERQRRPGQRRRQVGGGRATAVAWKSTPRNCPRTDRPATLLPMAGEEGEGRGAGVVGGVLADRYELGSRLGRGGTAVVFDAWDRVLDRRVAVKVLDALFTSANLRRRFLREARAAAGLAHPGLVAVLDTGEHDGLPFIVMEHVEGPTLAAVLAGRGALPAGAALQVAVDLCAALAAAHAHGLVHRDVKPANVMLPPGAVRGSWTSASRAPWATPSP